MIIPFKQWDMSPENYDKHLANVQEINDMSPTFLMSKITHFKCPFRPEYLIGLPIGMFHCNLCGEMVIAGFPHS